MQRHHLNLTAGLLVTAMTMPAMADNINWQSDGVGGNPAQYQGKWEDTEHWVGGNVPGADDNARWVSNWSSNGPAITTIDAATLTALELDEITVRSLYGHLGTANWTQSNRRSYLVVNGTELAPITLNVGSTTSAPDNAIHSSPNFFLDLNWANLNIIGTPTGQGINLDFHRPTTGSQTEASTFTDTNVTMLAAAAGKGMAIGNSSRAGQRLYMTRGSLTITNATDDARISLLGHNEDGHLSGLILTDTVLTTNDVLADDRARFIFNGENATAVSSISGTLDLNERGGAALNSGDISVGRVLFNSGNDGTEQFVVGSGATLTLTAAGFARSGNNNWTRLLADAANLDFAGTLKFSPDSGRNTQNLIVFGSDIGDDTAGYDDNYAIGTLDVSDLTAAEAVLNVIAAKATNNAAYVHALLLGDIGLADPGSFFAGDANIYYDPSVSDIAGTYAFGSGTGSLIAIPEPASALLFMGGALAMLRRRKVQA